MDLHAYTDEKVHERFTISTSVTTVSGAATPVTIKSAKHSATNNGLRNRVDVCVYNVSTSDALPKMPPNTTIQYSTISKRSQLFQMTVLVSASSTSTWYVVDCVAAPPPSLLVDVNCDTAAAVSRSAIACEKFCNSRCAEVDNNDDDVLLDGWNCCWWWWRTRPLLLLLLLLLLITLLLMEMVVVMVVKLSPPLRPLVKAETYWFSCCRCHVESWPIIYVNQVI